MADESGEEKADWYMGDELQKVEGVEGNPEVDESKAQRRQAQLEKKKAREKQQRRLAKEGLDDAKAAVRGRRKKKRQVDPNEIVGLKIMVKWYSRGGKNFVLTAKQAAKGSEGTFYKGKLTSYDKKTKRYRIKYDDGLIDTINLTDPKSTDYVPSSSWKNV